MGNLHNLQLPEKYTDTKKLCPVADWLLFFFPKSTFYLIISWLWLADGSPASVADSLCCPLSSGVLSAAACPAGLLWPCAAGDTNTVMPRQFYRGNS